MTQKKSGTERNVERFVHGQSDVNDDRQQSTKEQVAAGMSESSKEAKEAKGQK